MSNWIKTNVAGLRYKEHPSRKQGLKPDRYFNLRFQFDGVSIDQCLGWGTEGMTLTKATVIMADLKEEIRLGKGSGKLSDRRKAQRNAKEAEKAEEIRSARLTISYSTFFHERYEPKLVDKVKETARRETDLHRLWILPTIGDTPIRNLTSLDIERVKHQMLKAGRAPRTAQYMMAAIRMVINCAINLGYFVGINPVSNAKRLKFDNRRTRFLDHSQADQLLRNLKTRSQSVHDMALLSLHGGLRLGEIYSLCRSDVDLVHKIITLRNTKSGKTRSIPMTDILFEMFNSLPLTDSGLVFPDRSGMKRKGNISNSFDRAVKELHFNDGIDDIRQKITFHSLRHTHASWLACLGVELFTIKELLGHSSLQMTERYSHLSPKKLKAAISILGNDIEQNRENHSAFRTIAGGKSHG